MFPKTPESRERLYKYLCEAVEYLNEIDVQKADVANVKSIIKEEFDIPSSEITLLINALYNDEKVVSEIERRENALAHIDILTKKQEEKEAK